ncbi:MAG: hypothetical protein GY847_01850, partial [Proteobacteria bacterium]|nr:hypothetical protein [Pseudomonadota bacterium]
MRSHLTAFCLALLLTGTCGALLVEQRDISTDQIRCRILDDSWPKGLFYGIEDMLYWIRFREGRLFIYSLNECEIGDQWIIDLGDAPDNLRMTDVTSGSRDTLLVLFSGYENLIVRLDLNDRAKIQKATFSAAGHAHTIRYVADLEAAAVIINQTLALIIDE